MIVGEIAASNLPIGTRFRCHHCLRSPVVCGDVTKMAPAPCEVVRVKASAGQKQKRPALHKSKRRAKLCRSVRLRAKRGAGRSRTDDGGFAIRCLSLLATAPSEI